jgi:hypothetical protein
MVLPSRLLEAGCWRQATGFGNGAMRRIKRAPRSRPAGLRRTLHQSPDDPIPILSPAACSLLPGPGPVARRLLPGPIPIPTPAVSSLLWRYRRLADMRGVEFIIRAPRAPQHHRLGVVNSGPEEQMPIPWWPMNRGRLRCLTGCNEDDCLMDCGGCDEESWPGNREHGRTNLQVLCPLH